MKKGLKIFYGLRMEDKRIEKFIEVKDEVLKSKRKSWIDKWRGEEWIKKMKRIVGDIERKKWIGKNEGGSGF